MSDRAWRTSSNLASYFVIWFALSSFQAIGQTVFPDPKTPAEMTELAHKYATGIGCPRDAGQAMLWYKRAAQEGEPGAILAIGDMLEEGRCVDQDLVASAIWRRRAAEMNFAPAMERYAGALERGVGVPLDREAAKDWYRKAAKLGYAPAMTKLGDLEGNVEWYQKAVALGDAKAFGKLGLVTGDSSLFLQGAEQGDAVSMTELGRVATDDAEAVRWFRKAAEAGDPNGMERYAFCAERGKGMEASIGEAILWYHKAADRGHPGALTRIGILENDRKLVKRAVDAGYAPAMTALAKMQPEDSKDLYEAAAALGEPEALFRVGKVQESAARGYPEALAATGNLEGAAKGGHTASMIKLGWLRQAAEAGDPEGLYLYGMSLPDKLDGANWLRRAAEKGHARSMIEVALRASDKQECHRWLEAGAKAGEPEGLYRFGLLISDRASIQKAAEKGYAPAMVALGDKMWLEKAAGLGFANAFTKLGQLDRAAEMGDPEAKMLLADAMKSKKPRQAHALYIESAKMGYAPAMTRLGDCSLNGQGTSRSDIDALKWYRQALASGDAEAGSRLRSLGKTP